MNHCMSISYSILYNLSYLFKYRPTRAFNILFVQNKITTNKNKDAWFIGYTPDLVIGVYVGFDKPKSLGYKQTGSSVAVPTYF